VDTKDKKHEYSERNIKDLIPYINNSRTHSEEQINQVASSIKEFGFTSPILIDEQGGVIAGHGRIMAANKLGIDKVPCIELKGLTEAQKKAYVIADNQLALNSGWDLDMLKLEVDSLKELDFDINLLGFDDDFLTDMFDDEGELYADGIKGQMSSDFGFSPFTVLNAREGGWQKRKQYWISQGISSELGRDISDTITMSEVIGKDKDKGGGSIFDPVLCEIGYEWFSPKGGLILDPFAGGSVRGIVAAKCGREYVGNDLRVEQVEANRQQALQICEGIVPTWTVGDSCDIANLVGDIKADAIFSCPPYADLEVYSADPKDISNMPYYDFMVAYKKIISESFKLLKDNSFAVWTVGEVRDKKGNYLNFVGDTIQAFKDAGFNYYNEAILITPVGSLPLRAGKAMRASRKLGKTHQNVLIFVKGDGKLAAKRCGDIDIHIETDEGV